MKVRLQIDDDTVFELDGKAPKVSVLASQFCQLDDEEQADFFEAVGRIMETWGHGKAANQAYYIGRHMSKCECVTHIGRDWVREVVRAYDPA